MAATTDEADFYRRECLALSGTIALLSRENTALRARVEPMEARVHELEVDNQVLRESRGAG